MSVCLITRSDRQTVCLCLSDEHPGLETGIELFNPDQVLKIFNEKAGDHPGTFGGESIPPRHSSSCLETQSAQRTIRRIVNEAVAERDTETQKIIRKLGGACITMSAKLRLAEDREKGYVETLGDEMKKRKRGRPFTEELRAEDGVGVLLFSPSKVRYITRDQLWHDTHVQAWWWRLWAEPRNSQPCLLEKPQRLQLSTTSRYTYCHAIITSNVLACYWPRRQCPG